MTREELRAAINKLLNDPVAMAELYKSIRESNEALIAREEEYELEQRRLWDKHKHDTYY
jgi:hypothetical protein